MRDYRYRKSFHNLDFLAQKQPMNEGSGWKELHARPLMHHILHLSCDQWALLHLKSHGIHGRYLYHRCAGLHLFDQASLHMLDHSGAWHRPRRSHLVNQQWTKYSTVQEYIFVFIAKRNGEIDVRIMKKTHQVSIQSINRAYTQEENYT